MDKKRCLSDIDFKDKKVLVRVDFNVPIKNGVVDDDTRIVVALPTIQYLLQQNAKIILLSHLGRVKTLADKTSGKFSLKPVFTRLKELLKDVDVSFLPSCTGSEVKKAVDALKPKSILLLENTRYCDVEDDGTESKKESKCDDQLATFWASLVDVFVNDAFGTAHRNHASNCGVARHTKVKCLGFLIDRELSGLQKIIASPIHPYVVIVGGAKAADKISLIKNFLKTADVILLSGGIATSFLHAQGIDVGKSIIDEASVPLIKQLIASDHKKKIVLPLDFIVTKEFVDEPGIVLQVGDPFGDLMAMDIGPKTRELFTSKILTAKMLFWNGPPGVFEFTNFCDGTLALAKAIVKATQNGAYTLVGGGDSASAINKFGLQGEVSFISTGGGASLTLLEGKVLPAIEVVNEG